MHVMAGDQVELNVNNYYDSYSPGTDNPISASSMLSSIVGTLTGGVGGFQGSEGHNPDMVQQLFQPANYLSEYQNILNGVTDQGRPRAYLNYILFDENMQIDKSFSNAFQVNSNGSWEQIGTTAPLTIPANGYLAVYLSNQSQVVSCYDCATVHFDQLQVRLQKGRQLEESHYYPFGLPIAGLSSAAANNTIPQRRKYQSNEYIKELGLNWMDFNARQYDPQIGRFLGVDPLATSGGQDMFSPYAAMGNAPESMVDPNGTQFTDRNGTPNNGFNPNVVDYLELSGLGRSSIGGGSSGGSGLSGDLHLGTGRTAFYGAQAQMLWAYIIGYKSTQGIASLSGNFHVRKGFSKDQVIDAGWKIDGDYKDYFHAYRYVQSGNDLSSLEKETGKFLKPEEDVSLLEGFEDGFINADKSNMIAMSAMIGYEGALLGKTEMIVKLQFKAAQTFTSKKGFVSSIRGLEKAGKVIGAAGVVVNVIESATDANGFTAGDAIKTGIGIWTIYGGPIGWTYGLIDIGFGVFTGTTLTDRIGSGIDKAFE